MDLLPFPVGLKGAVRSVLLWDITSMDNYPTKTKKIEWTTKRESDRILIAPAHHWKIHPQVGID